MKDERQQRFGNENSIKHGATSERRVVPLARVQRRRVLRQLRLSPRDLDPVARGHLDAYVRLVAKIELLDAYMGEHGILKADGEPQGALRYYVGLQNAARLSLARLDDHLRKQKRDPAAVLAQYLDADASSS